MLRFRFSNALYLPNSFSSSAVFHWTTEDKEFLKITTFVSHAQMVLVQNPDKYVISFLLLFFFFCFSVLLVCLFVCLKLT